MPRPRTPLLTRESIKAAALALIDSDGLAAFSMRKLGAELGVRAPSLYGHYPTKEALVDDIAEEIIQRVDVSGFASADWQVALTDWARSYRAALAHHPNIVPFLAYGPALRQASLARADAVHGGLVRAGWPPRDATLIGAATKYIVVGAAMTSFSGGFVDDVQVYLDRYPNLTAAHRLREHAAEIDVEAFELALGSFLSGLAARYAELTATAR